MKVLCTVISLTVFLGLILSFEPGLLTDLSNDGEIPLEVCLKCFYSFLSPWKCNFPRESKLGFLIPQMLLLQCPRCQEEWKPD